MADWYTSSTAYAAIAAFVPSAVYTVGNIVKPTASVLKARWVFRCTTAGTASTEPAWPTANNSTITTGGATFTNVTGQSAYGWSAAAGDVPTLIGAVGTFRFAAGDRMFVSSDHSETQTTNTSYGSSVVGAAGFAVGQVLSVNRAGSVPPVAADLTAGASCAITGVTTLSLDTFFPTYHFGITYSAVTGLNVASGTGVKVIYLDTCQLSLTGASSSGKMANGASSTLVLYNTSVRFSHVGHFIGATTGIFEIIWLNTVPGIAAGSTVPTQLFSPTSNTYPNLVTVRGADLSAITTVLVLQTNAGSKYLFDSCRIAPGVARYNSTGTTNTRDEVELVNCYDGTNFISERYQASGVVTTEFTNTLSGGATDNVGTFSHKMVSTTNIDKYANTLNGFWLDVNYATPLGSAKTATVEIFCVGGLNNDEISLLLEYEGTVSSSVASFATTLPANVLTTSSAVTASSAIWSGPLTTVNWNSADSSSMTLSGSNLIATGTASGGVRCTVAGASSGKVYWECTVNTFTAAQSCVGVAAATAGLAAAGSTGIQVAVVYPNGTIYVNGINPATLGARSNGDIIGFALDVAAQLIWFRVAPAGNWNASGAANPATGTGGISVSALAGLLFPFFAAGVSGQAATANFGASGFSGAVPAGFTSGVPISGKQRLQATFTPRTAGRVRAQVKLGKASTTVYYDPQVTIT